MKRHFKITALFASALALLLGVCGCKGGIDLTGSYELHASQEETKYSVLFELSDPKEAIDNAQEHFVTTKFTRLKGVYIKFRTFEEGSERISLSLERCVVSDGPATYIYRGEVKANQSNKGVWIEPFDFSKTGPTNLIVETYMFYRISAEGGSCYIDEIVFIGEVLQERGGAEGTGEYIVQPVELLAATPFGEETEEQSLRRARTLLDEQPSSAEAFIK